MVLSVLGWIALGIGVIMALFIAISFTKAIIELVKENEKKE
jgi:preprotein translocase subunit SecD